MPVLPNPRHEKFAQALARGTSASAAYEEAGFKAHRSNAASMARKEHILARVNVLQEEQLAISAGHC
jgi:phage terminase small subunit